MTIRIAIAIASALLSGCVTPCIFGDTSENSHTCAGQNFGAEGLMFSVNDTANNRGDCNDHVQYVAGFFEVKRLHTPGHVSAVVEVQGTEYVLDNGFLRIPGNVIPLAEFASWYSDAAWTTSRTTAQKMD